MIYIYVTFLIHLAPHSSFWFCILLCKTEVCFQTQSGWSAIGQNSNQTTTGPNVESGILT